jgi:hypothetical protein
LEGKAPGVLNGTWTAEIRQEMLAGILGLFRGVVLDVSDVSRALLDWNAGIGLSRAGER